MYLLRDYFLEILAISGGLGTARYLLPEYPAAPPQFPPRGRTPRDAAASQSAGEGGDDQTVTDSKVGAEAG